MSVSRDPIQAFADAVALAGGQSAAARMVGVTQGAIWLRLRDGKPAAPGWVLALEAETGVSKHELRPDLYPRDGTAVATPSIGATEAAR